MVTRCTSWAYVAAVLLLTGVSTATAKYSGGTGEPNDPYQIATPRIISDNGPPFIARDFKQFVRISGMTHVRTSPYYPQSNGKLERFNQSVKVECIRPQTPLSLDDARRIVTDYVRRYNTIRLHSAIGYITPLDKFEGRAEQIFAARDAKLQAARAARRIAAATETQEVDA